MTIVGTYITGSDVTLTHASSVTNTLNQVIIRAFFIGADVRFHRDRSGVC